MVVQMCNEHRNEKVSSDQEYEAGNSVEYNRIYYKVIYLLGWSRKDDSVVYTDYSPLTDNCYSTFFFFFCITQVLTINKTKGQRMR